MQMDFFLVCAAGIVSMIFLRSAATSAHLLDFSFMHYGFVLVRSLSTHVVYVGKLLLRLSSSCDSLCEASFAILPRSHGGVITCIDVAGICLRYMLRSSLPLEIPKHQCAPLLKQLMNPLKQSAATTGTFRRARGTLREFVFVLGCSRLVPGFLQDCFCLLHLIKSPGFEMIILENVAGYFFVKI